MKTLLKSLVILFCMASCAGIAAAQEDFVDIGINTEKTVTTFRGGHAGLPSALGSSEDYRVILRIAPVVPGRKYEATITFNAEPDNSIHYAHAWVDGNPFGRDWHSFVGIATGTGSRDLKRDKQEKFIFTIDSKSTAGTLYIPLRSNKPFTFRFGVTDRLTGVNPNSRDRWGETYVNDFDAKRAAPFLLTRGVVGATTIPEPQGMWVNIGINTEKTVTTAQGLAGLPAALGSADEYRVVLRIAPVVPGRKYEATITFNAEPDNSIHYAHAWVDGNPFGKDWHSFVGIATGTGSRDLKRDKQEKFIFTIDSKSTAGALYIPLRSNKPFTFRFGITDRLTGVNPNSRDRWGETYVNDFDANRAAPFLLKR